jgi:hypothetical protein
MLIYFPAKCKQGHFVIGKGTGPSAVRTQPERAAYHTLRPYSAGIRPCRAPAHCYHPFHGRLRTGEEIFPCNLSQQYDCAFAGGFLRTLAGKICRGALRRYRGGGQRAGRPRAGGTGYCLCSAAAAFLFPAYPFAQKAGVSAAGCQGGVHLCRTAPPILCTGQH